MMLALGGTQGALAQDIHFFRIGTGPTLETRFPIGGLLANVLSNPPGSRECSKGGSCGVPGLVAVAQSTSGSRANLADIQGKTLDAALVHTDIAFWATHGTGLYRGVGPMKDLRGVALLYGESLHLVVRADSDIRTVEDLRGKRVSFGETGSGPEAHGQILLAAYGLQDSDVLLSHLKPSVATAALAAKTIDAILIEDGTPSVLLRDLARDTPIRLLPISGSAAERIRARYPFFTIGSIAAETYAGVDTLVPTLELGIALVTGTEQDPTVIEGITRALWHPSSQKMLLQGSVQGRLIRLDAEGFDRLGIPLHEGAAAYYRTGGKPPALPPLPASGVLFR